MKRVFVRMCLIKDRVGLRMMRVVEHCWSGGSWMMNLPRWWYHHQKGYYFVSSSSSWLKKGELQCRGRGEDDYVNIILRARPPLFMVHGCLFVGCWACALGRYLEGYTTASYCLLIPSMSILVKV